MKVRRTYLLAAALLALAVSASATTVVVPQNTVVPVTMDTSISSATSKAGDTFGAYHEGANGGGFADHTQFIGKVSSVTKAAADKPGQLGVEFVSVQLPDGR